LQLEQYERSAEAILFAGGEPLPLHRIAQALELDDEAAESVLESLSDRLDNSGSAIELLRLGDCWQLATREEYASVVRSALELKRNSPLSQAALEVLAVVAYNQPVTRAFAEQVRGVDCSGVISTLCERGLIEEAGRLELPGRPISYRTTADFLRCFGLESIDELPPVSEEKDELDDEGKFSGESADQQTLFRDGPVE